MARLGALASTVALGAGLLAVQPAAAQPVVSRATTPARFLPAAIPGLPGSPVERPGTFQSAAAPLTGLAAAAAMSPASPAPNLSPTSPTSPAAAAVARAASLAGPLPGAPLGTGGSRLRIYNPAPSPADLLQGTACSELPVSCSTNWAGEEAWGTTFQGISAEWTVPSVVPTSSATEDSSVWIGLDGDPLFDGTPNAPLLQLGTDAPSEGGAVTYETWYELLPGAEIPLFPVAPGDLIRASIEETAPGSNQWDVSIADLTTNLSWSDTNLSYQAPGASAEAVVEASTLCSSSGSCSASQLQAFGAVHFSDLQLSTSGGTPNLQQDDLVDTAGNVLAYPTVANPSLTVTEGAPPSTGSAGPVATEPGYGAETVSVTGTSASGTTPVQGACVGLYDDQGLLAYAGLTDPAGDASFPNVVPGPYQVFVDPTCGATSGPLAFQFYGGTADPAGATPVTVAPGTANAPIAVVLSAGASLSGTVSDGAGPVDAACVLLEIGSSVVRSTTTASSGSYAFSDLPPRQLRRRGRPDLWWPGRLARRHRLLRRHRPLLGPAGGGARRRRAGW